MDISSLSANALQMSASENQQLMITTMVKMDAKQQNAMAELLAQNVQQSSQAILQPDSRFGLSVYA